LHGIILLLPHSCVGIVRRERPHNPCCRERVEGFHQHLEVLFHLPNFAYPSSTRQAYPSSTPQGGIENKGYGKEGIEKKGIEKNSPWLEFLACGKYAKITIFLTERAHVNG
jgi:hypothetical protein